MTDVEFIGAHLVPSPEQLLRLQRVAAGAEPADLAVRDGTVLALHGRELLRRDVLICGPHIAAVTPPGRLAATGEIDAAGCWISPGFIDTHLHIEYTLLTPGEVMQLGPNEQLVFVAGCPPIRARKLRYFEDRELRGRCLPPPPPGTRDLPPCRGDDWSDLARPAVAPSASGRDSAPAPTRSEQRLFQDAGAIPVRVERPR